MVHLVYGSALRVIPSENPASNGKERLGAFARSRLLDIYIYIYERVEVILYSFTKELNCGGTEHG